MKNKLLLVDNWSRRLINERKKIVKLLFKTQSKEYRDGARKRKHQATLRKQGSNKIAPDYNFEDIRDWEIEEMKDYYKKVKGINVISGLKLNPKAMVFDR